MKTAIFTLLAILAVDAFAGEEVGASNPKAEWVIAAWDAGTSTSWAFEPTDSVASHKSMQEFELRVEKLNEHVNQKIEVMLERKLDAMLAVH